MSESNTVKRYIIHYDGRGEEEHPNGDFVHWSEHKTVQIKLENAERRIKELEDSNEDALRRVRSMRDENLKLERDMIQALEDVAQLKNKNV